MPEKLVTSADAAVADIPSGATLLIGGFGLCGLPERLLASLQARGPACSALTVVSMNAGTDGCGLDLLLRARQVQRLIASHAGGSCEFQRLYMGGELEFDVAPQGTLAERLRAGGAGIAAFYTPTGYGTLMQLGGFPIKYARGGGGAVEISSAPREARDFGGRGHLLETAIRGDFALVKGWRADAAGNVVFRGTALNFNPDMARAATVAVVEVEELVPAGAIAPADVHLPGIYVHRIVLGAGSHDRRLERRIEAPLPAATACADARARIARRVAREFADGMCVNLGVGVPTAAAGFVPPGRRVAFPCETGLLGAGPYPAPGTADADLSNAGKEAVTALPGASVFSSAESFAMIRGRRVDLAVLGALQVSASGDLASWIGPGGVVGMGGAMDLVASGARIIVAMQHMARGAHKILEVCTLPLTGARAVSRIITELAVIDVLPHGAGLRLVELAEGATVAGVVAQTGARLEIAQHLARA